MKRIKAGFRSQGFLFPTGYIADRLETSDEVHQFSRLLDKLDTKSLLGSYKSEGGSLIHPRDHLAVILYAYFQGIQSSKKISKLTRVNIEFIYLSGGHHIKDRTIRSFRVRNKSFMKEIFESSIHLAIDIGLVNPNDIFSLDGTKLASNASLSKSRKKSDWEKRRQKIVRSIDHFFEEWEAQDKLDQENEDEEQKKLEMIQSKLDKIKDGSYRKKIASSDSQESSELSADSQQSQESQKEKPNTSEKTIEINNLEKAESLFTECKAIENLLESHSEIAEESYLNIVEPESHPMKSNGTIIEAYNAQAITNNQVIVANNISENENDQHDLVPMVNRFVKILEKIPGKFPTTVPKRVKFLADAGYNKGSNLSFVDKINMIDAYISMNDRSKSKRGSKSKFSKDYFHYNEETDCWMCPSGQNLEFIKEHISKEKKFTLYGCTKEICLRCANYDSCVTTKKDKARGYRTIDDDAFVIFRNEMRNKMQTDAAREIYAKRSPEIEGVFGQIKNNKGLRRFVLRGLEKVKAEFHMISLTHNMGKILKHFNKNPDLWKAYS